MRLETARHVHMQKCQTGDCQAKEKEDGNEGEEEQVSQTVVPRENQGEIILLQTGRCRVSFAIIQKYAVI